MYKYTFICVNSFALSCPARSFVNFCLAYKVIPSLLYFVIHTYCWIAQIHCCVTPVDLEIPGSLRSFLPAKHLLSFKFYVSFFVIFFAPCTIASSPLSISLTLEDPIWPYIDGFTKHNLLWPGKVVLNMPNNHNFRPSIFSSIWVCAGWGQICPRTPLLGTKYTGSERP